MKIQLFEFETLHAAFRLAAKEEQEAAAATRAVADLEDAVAKAARGEASASRPAAKRRYGRWKRQDLWRGRHLFLEFKNNMSALILSGKQFVF